MSEKLNNHASGASDLLNAQERLDLIVPPEVDESGRTVTPAIDFGTGFMPNGQPVASFYDRGTRTSEEAEWMARYAVARAAKRLLGS